MPWLFSAGVFGIKKMKSQVTEKNVAFMVQFITGRSNPVI